MSRTLLVFLAGAALLMAVASGANVPGPTVKPDAMARAAADAPVPTAKPDGPGPVDKAAGDATVPKAQTPAPQDKPAAAPRAPTTGGPAASRLRNFKIDPSRLEELKRKAAKRKGESGTGPLAGATCEAAFYIENREVNYFDPSASYVPDVFDNSGDIDMDGITMGEGTHKPDAITYGFASLSTDQLLASTLEIEAEGTITLTYMANTPLHKFLFQPVDIVLVCVEFEGGSVKLDHHKTSFTDAISAEIGDDSALYIHVPEITHSHHCAQLKAVIKYRRCEHGECCDHHTGDYHGNKKLCRHPSNPCWKPTYCDGTSPNCPNPEARTGSCIWDGHQRDGVSVATSALKHTRFAAGDAVSVASTSAAIPSYDSLDECRGTCQESEGHAYCQIDARQEMCCKEGHGGYYGGYGGGYNDYKSGYGDYYPKSDYPKSDYGYDSHKPDYPKSDYGYDSYKPDYGYGYGKYAKAETAAVVAEKEPPPMISCWGH